MQISELIKLLQQAQETHGDVKVFTNGEHGINQALPLIEGYVDVLKAGGENGLLDEHDAQYFKVKEDETIVHIGGY